MVELQHSVAEIPCLIDLIFSWKILQLIPPGAAFQFSVQMNHGCIRRVRENVWDLWTGWGVLQSVGEADQATWALDGFISFQRYSPGLISSASFASARSHHFSQPFIKLMNVPMFWSLTLVIAGDQPLGRMSIGCSWSTLSSPYQDASLVLNLGALEMLLLYHPDMKVELLLLFSLPFHWCLLDECRWQGKMTEAFENWERMWVAHTLGWGVVEHALTFEELGRLVVYPIEGWLLILVCSKLQLSKL